MTPKFAIGIDLGTTYSAVAYVDNYGKPMIIPNSESERITPSVVMFDGPSVIVGTLAKQNAVAEPEKIVDFVKREIGKSKKEFSREFNGITYSAEEISALILKKLRRDAENYLGAVVNEAVITVPAYFNDPERTATIAAGELAGLKVLQVLNEPTAAALAFGIDKLGSDQTIFVFDLGGGTFDVTIMEIEGGNLRMLATNGDHRLGGKDWDDILVNVVADEFDRLHGENPLLDLQSYQDLQSRAIAAKIQLSTRPRTTIVHSHNGKSIKIEITREEFEMLSRHLVERCKALCEIVMQEAHLGWNAIDKILLVGGMTRVPMIQKMISDLSGKPITIDVSPDEAVALGAAIQATLCKLADEKPGDAPSISPTARKALSGKDGGLIEVTNITSHTLGVVLWNEATLEEYVFPMIKKMTPIPAEVKNSFGTAVANMNEVIVRVVEGESSLPEECTPLGVCRVELPPFLPKGSPVELTYRWDANQTLHVTVNAFGNTGTVEINRASAMSPDEIAAARASLSLLKVE